VGHGIVLTRSIAPQNGEDVVMPGSLITKKRALFPGRIKARQLNVSISGIVIPAYAINTGTKKITSPHNKGQTAFTTCL
jgi:hypothetical protein